MGAWGITAFESDDGLDTLGFIRKTLPADGKLIVSQIIADMQTNEWTKPPDVSSGVSHSGPMALAEIMIKFLDSDTRELDYDEEWAADDNKFSSVTSFVADKESIVYLRDYISGTLKHKQEVADIWANRGEDTSRTFRKEWGGWREEKDWTDWQNHMQTLVNRLESLLSCPDDQIELLQPQSQTEALVMEQQM